MRRVPLAVSIIAIALAGCAPEGPTAFVDLNLPLDEECQVNLGSGDVIEYLSSGWYDVASRHPSGSDNYCARDYNTRLRINSFLRPNADRDLGRAEPNILQVHSAEVTLRAQNDAVLDFDGGALPNPFRLITGVSLFPSQSLDPAIASITIKTIPAAYAEYLDQFEDQTIVADIQLFATTTGDVDVDFKVFPYPIQICNGCLTRCASVFESADATESREQIIGDVCDDDSGQDGRVCYDISC